MCDDWTKFVEAEFQKESWDGIKGTLFTFKSTNEFVNFSESGWNKIDQLRWREAGGIWNGSGEWDGKNLVRMARKDVSTMDVFEGSLDQC